MIKRILIGLALLVGSAFGQAPTPNLGLGQPAHGSFGWDTIYNSSFLTIDSVFGVGNCGGDSIHALGYSAGSKILTCNVIAGSGSGDVVGPASSVTNHVAGFANTTGKLLLDLGVLPSTKANVANQWFNSYDASTGSFTSTQPGFSNLSGSATCGQLPALTGDATTSAGTCGTTVVKINGTSFAGSNGNLVQFGASNTPVDSAVVAANVMTASAGVTSGNIPQGAGTKTFSDSGIAASNLVTAASAFTSGDLVQAAGNNKTTSDSGLVAANTPQQASNGAANQIASYSGANKNLVPVTTLPTAAVPAFTGDMTTAGGSLTTVVAKVNGNTPGATCTNQVVTSIDSSARGTCTSVPEAAMANVTYGQYTGAGAGTVSIPTATTKMWGYFTNVPITTTAVAYNVNTADNTGDLYDMGIYDSAGNLIVHIGATAGTTFAPSTGSKNISWIASGTIPAGKFYIGLTCNTGCTAVMGGSQVSSFAINQNGPAPVSNALVTGTPPADSFSLGPVPSLGIH